MKVKVTVLGSIFSFWCIATLGIPLNIDSTIKIIEDEKIDRVAKFIGSKSLPNIYRSNFNVLKKSTRIQPSSLKLPRIISYDENELFIFSFNGGLPARNSTETRNEALEIMQYSNEKKIYDFYSIHFFPDQEKSYQLRGPDLPECNNCHLNRLPMLYEKTENLFTNDELNNFINRLFKIKDFDDDALRRYSALDWHR